MSNEPAEPPAVSPNEGPERALVPAIAGTGANEPIGAMPSGAAPPDDSEPKEEDTPDDASRQRMKDVASTGWAAAEANYYDRVGAAHSGSGDIYSYYYYGTAQVNGKKYSLERVPRQHREKVQIVYVPPSMLYDRAMEMLNENHVLVLYGDAGIGKYYAALHLLTTKLAAEIFDVSHKVDLDDPNAFTIEPLQGYIVENLAQSRVSNLNPSTLRRLNSHLQAKQSYMVITVQGRIAPDLDSLSDYALLWVVPTERIEMLRRHLKWHMRDDDELRHKAEAHCQDAKVQSALANLSPRVIDGLASEMKLVVLGKQTLDQVLRPFVQEPEQQVEDWFDQHPALEQRTLMLAIAVFHGGRYQDIIEADKQLQTRIKLLPEDSPPQTPNFDIPRSVILTDIGAQLAPRVGIETVDRVVLKNAALQANVLRYVWREYYGSRAAIQEWLHYLGRSDDIEKRDKVALAISELGRQDFETIYAQSIKPLANSVNGRARTLSAMVLSRLYFSQEELARQILAILHGWSQSKSQHLQWTAALAYSILAGPEFPFNATDDLYTIAATGKQALVSMAGNSVVDLFELGKTAPTYYFRVIEVLDGWTAHPKPDASVLNWLGVFVRIAGGAKHPTESGSSWPTLLWIYAHHQQYQTQIRTLWRRALNHQVSRENALAALRSWLQAADRDPALLPPLTQLIADLVGEGDERERLRLRYWLARWAGDRKQQCASAVSISATIGRDSFAKEACV